MDPKRIASHICPESSFIREYQFVSTTRIVYPQVFDLAKKQEESKVQEAKKDEAVANQYAKQLEVEREKVSRVRDAVLYCGNHCSNAPQRSLLDRLVIFWHDRVSGALW